MGKQLFFFFLSSVMNRILKQTEVDFVNISFIRMLSMYTHFQWQLLFPPTVFQSLCLTSLRMSLICLLIPVKWTILAPIFKKKLLIRTLQSKNDYYLECVYMNRVWQWELFSCVALPTNHSPVWSQILPGVAVSDGLASVTFTKHRNRVSLYHSPGTECL